MLWEKIHGDPKIGDINTNDNRFVNVIFATGVVVTLMACAVFVMYGLL